MKNLKFCAILALALTISSCEKNLEIDTPINNQSSTFNSLSEKVGPGWFRKIVDWVVEHSGVYLGPLNCNMQLPCGDCPGICLSNAANNGIGDAINNGDILNANFTDEGQVTFGVELWESDNGGLKLKILINEDYDKLLLDNTLYITQDAPFSNLIKNHFGLSVMELKKGNYLFQFNTDSGYFEAYIDAILEY